MERESTTLAIVVSEDGGVDLIPDPRPMIKRSLISAAVAEMEQISRATRMPRRRYNDLYDWLRRHRFYLLPDDCEGLNIAVQEIQRRFDEETPASVWAVREKFEPDPRMQPSFYYVPEDQDV